MSPTGDTEVRVTLPHGQETRALLGVAGGLAPAPREAILTCEKYEKINCGSSS